MRTFFACTLLFSGCISPNVSLVAPNDSGTPDDITDTNDPTDDTNDDADTEDHDTDDADSSELELFEEGRLFMRDQYLLFDSTMVLALDLVKNNNGGLEPSQGLADFMKRIHIRSQKMLQQLVSVVRPFASTSSDSKLTLFLLWRAT